MMTEMTPVRVLQVLPALGDGGVEQSAVDMALYTKAKGWEPMVTSAGGHRLGALQSHGVRHFHLPLESKLPWRILWNSLKLWRLIRAHRIQIIHARSRGPAWSAWLACNLPFAGRVEYVTTFHGTYNTRGWGKKWYNAVMLKGRWVIANSAFIKQHIIDTYGVAPDRIAVAARGVDPDTFDPARFSDAQIKATRTECGVDDKTPLLLMVGRQARWKGHHVLLEALAELTDLKWVLAFAGGADKRGAYTTQLHEMAKALGLNERVVFLGSRQDIPLLNAAADLAFSCSTEPEAFGRVAIEAMAMETPIIASALGGSLETIREGETGWLVTPDAPHPLAETIRTALTAPKRLAKMGADARRHVLGHFTTAQTCAAEMAVYERLLTPDA